MPYSREMCCTYAIKMHSGPGIFITIRFSFITKAYVILGNHSYMYNFYSKWVKVTHKIMAVLGLKYIMYNRIQNTNKTKQYLKALTTDSIHYYIYTPTTCPLCLTYIEILISNPITNNLSFTNTHHINS